MSIRCLVTSVTIFFFNLLLPVWVLTRYPLLLLVQKLTRTESSNIPGATLEIVTYQAYQLAVLGRAQTPILLTPEEVSHLLDVHVYLRLGSPGVMAVLFCALILLYRNHAKLMICVRIVAKLMALFVLFCLMSIAFFSKSFLIFHLLLFPKGNWSFPASSLLITAFPENFWLYELILFLSVFILQLTIMLFVITKKTAS